jgi:serpin B
MPEIQAASEPSPKQSDLDAVVQANVALAGALFPEVVLEGSNLFFAPTNVTAALAMTYAGARGETAAGMAGALHFPPLDPARLHAALGALEAALRAAPGVELAIANTLFGQQRESFLPDFLALLAECYGAGLQQVDFVTKSEQARLTINGWVKQQTKGKIVDLISPGGVGPPPILVLVSAVYFKGSWASKFEERNTWKAPFYRLDGRSATVPLMSQSHEYRLTRWADASALEFPYQGNAISMVVILPERRDGLPALEARLPSEMAGWLARIDAARPEEVEAYLPRFRVETSLNLNEALMNLGMTAAFEDADFSGMNGEGRLAISDVFHKAFVEVTEQGTTAAAATAADMALGGGVKNPTFRADHPFLFLIRDRRTKALLFLGRFVGPAG